MILQVSDDITLIHDFAIFSFVLISLIMGIKLISKYKSTGQKIYITIGLSWICLSGLWWIDFYNSFGEYTGLYPSYSNQSIKDTFEQLSFLLV